MALSILLLRAFFSFSTLSLSSQLSVLSLFALLCSVYILSFWISRRNTTHVLIVDYGCFNAPASSRVPFSSFSEHSKLAGSLDEGSTQLQEQALLRSGLSQCTCLPTSLHYLPPRITLLEQRRECEAALFGAVDELFASTSVRPQQVGIVVTNCSVFSPIPSIASMIVQRFKLPVSVKSFNLAGMGCAAGPLALDLAKRVLCTHPRMYALVVSTENLTSSWYLGKERSMLAANCVYRVGGSAVLLSNKRGDRKISKYRVLHTTRSHIGANDKAYRCVYQEEDSKGLAGIRISEEATYYASLALEHTLKMLGPKVLPTWEMIMCMCNAQRRRVSMDVKPYIPKWRLAFDNICIQAGNKQAMEAIAKTLDLPYDLTESTSMTLYRYGNLSSAMVWYELAYEEAQGKIKRGNKVWQIGFGSGFLCCSTVLEALKTVDNIKVAANSCWEHCIIGLLIGEF